MSLHILVIVPTLDIFHLQLYTSNPFPPFLTVRLLEEPQNTIFKSGHMQGFGTLGNFLKIPQTRIVRGEAKSSNLYCGWNPHTFVT